MLIYALCMPMSVKYTQRASEYVIATRLNAFDLPIHNQAVYCCRCQSMPTQIIDEYVFSAHCIAHL